MTETNKLKKEFQLYMEYWMLHMYRSSKTGVYPEISNDDIPNEKALLGSMYLSRIIYGASQAGDILGTDKYRSLATSALDKLLEFKNPGGGYYWARTYNMEWVHDAENVNMSQAFVLYGLAAFLQRYPSEEVNALMIEQLKFVQGTLKDRTNSFYLDGFDEHWVRQDPMTIAFATHFHMMEALVMVYEYNQDQNVKKSVQELLHIILNRFIDKKDYACIHRFTENWEVLPNENWAGHNSECAWVMVQAARAIEDQALIDQTEEMLIFMIDAVIQRAKDQLNGGYFNVIPENDNFEKTKSWWPQAEIALGLYNAFQITGDARYDQLASEQVTYIQEFFVQPGGEWLAQVSQKGEALQDFPKIFFWKSMYHTVRYYDFLIGQGES